MLYKSAIDLHLHTLHKNYLYALFCASRGSYFLCMLQWRDTKEAEVQLTNLPDKLKSVKLFSPLAKINVHRVNGFTTRDIEA